MIAISASGDKRAFEFVSGNLCGMTFSHVEKCMAQQRAMLFINIAREGWLEVLLTYFERIHTKSHEMIR